MSRVSIVMSSYNHASYVRAAIDSVLGQTYADFELFILDDASTDASWEIIQGCSDPRIHLLRNPVNRNDRQVINHIIRDLATGEFVAVHHSDNAWEPDKLKQQVGLLDARPEVGAVFTNARIIDERGEPFKDRTHFYFDVFEQPNRSRQEWLNYFFHHGNALCHPSVLIRKQCYDECGYYRNGFAQIPDLDMWVRLCLKYEIHVLPGKLVHYRVQSDASQSSADLPATRVRAHMEYLHVLEHYRSITSFEELVRIFPDAEAYRRPASPDLNYVLGMLALSAAGGTRARQLLGLNLLFEVISDPPRAARVADLYGFTHKDYIALTAKYDVFSVDEPNRLQTRLAFQVYDILQSGTWKVSRFLVRVGVALVPPGSLGYRVLRRLYRFIAALREKTKGRGDATALG